MTTPGTAWMFRAGTLLEGKCTCVFHRACVGAKCDRCVATSVTCERVFHYNCLACNQYTSDLFCAPCWKGHIDMIHCRLGNNYSSSFKVDDFFFPLFPEKIQNSPIMEVFLAWCTFYLMQQRGLPFVLARTKSGLEVRSFVWVVITLWQMQLKHVNEIPLYNWHQIKLNGLIPDLARTMQLAANLLPSLFNIGMHAVNGTIVKQEVEAFFSESSYASGRELLRTGAHRTGRVFLAHENDYLYFTKRTFPPLIDDFYKIWNLAIETDYIRSIVE